LNVNQAWKSLGLKPVFLQACSPLCSGGGEVNMVWIGVQRQLGEGVGDAFWATRVEVPVQCSRLPEVANMGDGWAPAFQHHAFLITHKY